MSLLIDLVVETTKTLARSKQFWLFLALLCGPLKWAVPVLHRLLSLWFPP